MEQLDIAVIGAGPGGFAAAVHAAQAGKRVVLIEQSLMGGTCLNRGCIPTKSFLHSTEVFYEATHSTELGVTVADAHLNFEGVRSRAENVMSTLRTGMTAQSERLGIEYLEGCAHITADHHIKVECADGSCHLIDATDIIIATGTTPSLPPIEGLSEAPYVYTSDDLLRDFPALESLIVIGGGVIGSEIACGYVDAGAKVTILEAMPRLLATLDADLGKNLGQILKRKGCQVATSAQVTRVEACDQGVRVHYQAKNKEQIVEAQAVLVATGRSGNIANLFEEEPCESQRGYAVVDSHYQTSIPHIFAIGDIIWGSTSLAHGATAEGIEVARFLTGASPLKDTRFVPGCVYTTPEIATVGLTEKAAREAGYDVVVHKQPFGANGKAVITSMDRGFVKIVADASSRKALGAHLMCSRATDMIGEVAVGIALGHTIEDLACVVRPHPTFEESIGEAFEAMAE